VGQLRDDINYHLDSKIVEIIHEIDRREDSDSVCSSVNVFNEASEWWAEPPDSDDEDRPSYSTSIEPPLIDGLEVDGTNDEGNYYDTDTEDGAEEHIALIEANMQLIAFLKRQSLTIARLRQRVLRLRSRITELTSQLDNPTRRAVHADSVPFNDTPTDQASVLFAEAPVDTTFIAAKHRDPVVKLDHLYHPK
jgi:hypothetical protein